MINRSRLLNTPLIKNHCRLNPAILAIAVLTILILAPRVCAEPLPDHAQSFLTSHCLDCHAGDESKGSVNLDVRTVRWQSSKSIELWERVFNVLQRNDMPPADAEQPSDGERKQFVAWLEKQLNEHAKPGGTTLRRLNREEYENSIRDLFGLLEFQLPDAFPSDDADHGFDNIGEALILSPPLLAQYLELATLVADEVLPPARGPVVAEPRRYDIGAAGLAGNSATWVVGDRFRIGSSKNENAATAGWPARFEAAHSGVYRLTVDARAFQTDKMFFARTDEPFHLWVYAKSKTNKTYAPFSDLRKLAEFEVHPNRDTPQTFTVAIELNKGEVFGLRWQNGPFDSNDVYGRRLDKDRRAHAAMLQLGRDPRGMSQADYYDTVASLMNSDKLDMDDPWLDKPREKFGGLGGGGLVSGRPRVMVNWFLNEELRRFGPSLDVTDVSIEGPLRLIEDDETRIRKSRTAKFLGTRPENATDSEQIETVLRRFLPRAFRRPVSDEQITTYLELAMREVTGPSATGRIEDGLHVVVRRALSSPRFLYRSLRPGQLDDFDLASRLSYFLTSSPPDPRLYDLASRGKLSEPKVLRGETLRLLKSPKSKTFVKRFTGQWLGTRVLSDIMPDPRLVSYYEAHRVSMTQEVERFFDEILRENYALNTFIDPGFSYRNKYSNTFYGGDLQGSEMQRVEFARGDRHGGLLGLAAVMMATANGVDTNPVQRGVWLLKNVFGTPVPEPPSNVPAISPDTGGVTTMKMRLEAHRADESCARCHNLIDPLGMVLENFDPVGRWRDHYPIYVQPADGEEALKEQFYSNTGKGTKAGPPIDSVGTLEDGTRLEDVTQLKKHLLENIDIFSRCLTGKLLTYATGRPLNFGDKQVVDRIVEDVKNQGNGFRDLIVAVVQCESFGIK